MRQFIPARLQDNPSLNYNEYMAALQGIGPAWLVQAMADGNWNVKAGGALDDIWNEDTHTMPKFKIPPTWYVDRTFDWGTTHPWACLYFAESDGSDVIMPDGTEIPTLPGDLFVIDELYGCTGKADAGTGEIPKEVAAKIKQRDKELELDNDMDRFCWGSLNFQYQNLRGWKYAMLLTKSAFIITGILFLIYYA